MFDIVTSLLSHCDTVDICLVGSQVATTSELSIQLQLVRDMHLICVIKHCCNMFLYQKKLFAQYLCWVQPS